MSKKKKSIGSLFFGFIMGLITFVLILVLIVSVGSNILFHSDESAPKIDILNRQYTLFVNNSNDVAKIENGDFVLIDSKSEFKENTYVLCSLGSGYKTIMCLSSVSENENGTLSYNLRGDKNGSVAEYSVPHSKLLGTVMNKVDYVGDIIRFSRDMPGIVTLMAVPSFLLIIISISSIRRKKMRFEDDLLESEIFIEELKKVKRNEEKRAEENKKKSLQAEQDITPASAVSKNSDFSYDEYIRQPEEKPEVNRYEYVNFEDEAAKKAIEIKKALLNETSKEKEQTVSEPAVSKSDDHESDNKTGEVQSEVKSEYTQTEKKADSIYSEQINPEAPVYQPEPAPVEAYNPVRNTESEKQPEPMHFVDLAEYKNTEAAKVQETLIQPEKPKTEPAAPVKKKTKPPVKKIKADSIDDLIKLLEDEKKKLD